MAAETNQKKLRKFVQRRHPEYAQMLPHWEFLSVSYEGGRSWFADNIFRYLKEGDQEFTDRLKRAYRFNHTREVVDLVDKYIFKMAIERSEDAPESVKKFWRVATLNGMTIRDLMKQISKQTSIFGRIWIVVDNNAPADIRTKAEERAVQTYAYIVDPRNALDMSYDDSEQLNWILIHEQERDDQDPLTSSGGIVDRFRLWERHQSRLFTIVPKSRNAKRTRRIGATGADRAVVDLANEVRQGKVGDLGAVTVDYDDDFSIVVAEPVPHNFEGVPVFAADHLISRELYRSPSMIDDIAYLDRAVANYLSNLDAIIQDQTFSQLVIPAQAVSEDDNGTHNKLVEMGTKRIFTYDAEGGNAPQFISPDVKQAQVILSVVAKIINEIYHTAGLAGERTKEDNSQGIDNSSGVAKAYDFERVNSMLAAKADSLELIEHRLAEFVARWHGETIPAGEDPRLVSYPDNFDVRSLYDEFEIAARLSLIEAPDEVRRHQIMTLIQKLFPQLKKELLEKMKAEVGKWPPEPDLVSMNASGSATSSESKNAISEASKNSLANKLVSA